MNKVILETKIGTFIGNSRGNSREFLGIPYGRAGRFEYAEMIDRYEGEFEATKMGNACPQFRQYYANLEDPARLFYYREFRQGIDFTYDEDCLNLNIYTPKKADKCPVIVFFHGGSFNSGCNSEDPFKGYELAERGIITVFVNYRIGVLGYFCHEEIEKKYGRNGNFGLDDQLQAIRWVNRHIEEFGGDKKRITIMGQSAGAMSVQYHCLNHDNEGLFNRAVMLSGGGLFPKLILPIKAEETYDYWQEMMELAGCETFMEFKKADIMKIHDAYEAIKKKRKDHIGNMSPVIDGCLLKDDTRVLVKDPLKVDYLLSYTSNDIYAPLMAYVSNSYARKHGAYVSYFDIDLPGDQNGAFHSCDLRYFFGTLSTSWRPFREEDYAVSKKLMDYLSEFAAKGDPNKEGLPLWQKTDKNNKEVLCVKLQKIGMGKPSYLKMIFNVFSKGEPKA